MFSDCLNKSLNDNDSFYKQNKNIKNILNNIKLKENQPHINDENNKKIKKNKFNILQCFCFGYKCYFIFLLY